jgi:DNA-binding HxlR family transcriptional regulator
MTEVWNEQISVTNTIRENILLYLSQEEEVKKDELRSTISMTRDSADQHLRFLEEHGFVAKQLDHSMHPEYQLTDKGDELVGELRWGDQS